MTIEHDYLFISRGLAEGYLIACASFVNSNWILEFVHKWIHLTAHVFVLLNVQVCTIGSYFILDPLSIYTVVHNKKEFNWSSKWTSRSNTFTEYIFDVSEMCNIFKCCTLYHQFFLHAQRSSSWEHWYYFYI